MAKMIEIKWSHLGSPDTVYAHLYATTPNNSWYFAQILSPSYVCKPEK